MTTALIVIGVILLLVFLVAGGTTGRGVRLGKSGTRLEARLEPVRQEGPTWMASGRADREQRADGREDLRVRVLGIRTGTGEPRLRSGDPIELWLDDDLLTTAPLKNRGVQLHLRSDRGAVVPPVRAGAVISLRYQGHVLLRGTFSDD